MKKIELQMQLASLRHCELIKGYKEDRAFIWFLLIMVCKTGETR
jgi:hypothetical protein